MVVEMPTITPEFSRLLNCISIKNNNASTINSNSQLLVSSKRKTIEKGIIAPMPIPKYLYMLIPLCSSITKNSHSPTMIKTATTRPHNQSINIMATMRAMREIELIILFSNFDSAKSSFPFLILFNRLIKIFLFKIRPIFLRKIELCIRKLPE